MIPFPDKKYDIIYADPPWSYSDKGCNGNAAEHYPTMTVDEICKMPVNVTCVHANAASHPPPIRVVQISKWPVIGGGGGGVLLPITVFCSCGRPTP